ncbi:glutamate synthase-related protein [Candidatus Omnitrophota bacterium]
MAIYECSVCGHRYDEEKAGTRWEELSDDWLCPVCESKKSYFHPVGAQSIPQEAQTATQGTMDAYLNQWARDGDQLEEFMKDIHSMALTGESIIEPMRSRKPVVSWDDILIKGAQLTKIPLNKEVSVNTQTVIGPKAKQPLVIETPLYVTHMSFGALSREAKIAIARGSAAVHTATCSGEGGILKEARDFSYKYILEYVPHRYSITDENLKNVDAVEIKVGQSTKPGMGGHLPGKKVTREIAEIRGFPEGKDIISPAHFDDILNKEDLKKKVRWLREKTGGRPIGVKIAAGNLEADLEIVIYAEPDFITIDGRVGATGASPKFVKQATSIPTIFSLYRARKFLDSKNCKDISLVITGGLRISPDVIKALALGADATAIGTSALIALGCQQYRICNTGKCPVGITTQDPELRARFNVDFSAKRLENFLRVSTGELKDFARLTGNDDIHKVSIADLCTTNSEISRHTAIEHV